MTLFSVQDLLFFVGAICLIWITIFLCWTLYQIGKLVRQGNEMVGDTRHKIAEIERIVTGVGRSLGSIAMGGKMIQSFLKNKKKKHTEDED